MDTRRLILFVIFSFSIMMLWDAWQQKNNPVIDSPTAQTTPSGTNAAGTPNTADADGVSQTNVNDGSFKLASGQRVQVKTDLFTAEIDTVGGDLRRLVLNKHEASNPKDGHFVLMDDQFKPMFYVAQSGLMGADLPNHKSTFTSTSGQYALADGQDSQEVRLSWTGNNGVSVDKVYTFHRNSSAH